MDIGGVQRRVADTSPAGVEVIDWEVRIAVIQGSHGRNPGAVIRPYCRTYTAHLNLQTPKVDAAANIAAEDLAALSVACRHI